MKYYKLSIPVPKLAWGWPRFRVRTLLGVTTVFCLLLVTFLWWNGPIDVSIKVPILGPVTTGNAMWLDPPGDAEVMKALKQALPSGTTLPSANLRIVKEKTADYSDPVRNYPIIGPAQLHHVHYKCTVYDGGGDYSFDGPYVVYIDHNHLHLAAKTEPQ